MGMTDHQFDVYQESLLRDLERIREEIAESNGNGSKTLERLIQDTESHLKRQ